MAFIFHALELVEEVEGRIRRGSGSAMPPPESQSFGAGWYGGDDNERKPARSRSSDRRTRRALTRSGDCSGSDVDLAGDGGLASGDRGARRP